MAARTSWFATCGAIPPPLWINSKMMFCKLLRLYFSFSEYANFFLQVESHVQNVYKYTLFHISYEKDSHTAMNAEYFFGALRKSHLMAEETYHVTSETK